MAWLAEAVSDIDKIEALLIVQNPTGNVWESWKQSDFEDQELAAYFADMVRAQRHICQELAPELQEIQLTIESNLLTVLVTELSSRFIGVFIFRNPVPLGLVRLAIKKLTERILSHLPTEVVEVESEAKRLIEFILRYAPDPHIVMERIALKARIPSERIYGVDNLSREEIARIREAAEEILGISIDI